jgi:hypothetical protein
MRKNKLQVNIAGALSMKTPSHVSENNGDTGTGTRATSLSSSPSHNVRNQIIVSTSESNEQLTFDDGHSSSA